MCMIPGSYEACLKLSCRVCCRYSSGRCCFEHSVSPNERPLELALYREHTENHQAALRYLHREVELPFRTKTPSNLERYVHLYTFIYLLMIRRIFCFSWLDVGVARLTSAPCWVIYLQVLQEAVWPGGTLPVQPRPERSAAQRQEAKKQCLDCLMQLLPGQYLQKICCLNPVCF